MRVAITGADGFTGRYLTAELTQRGIDWVAIDADLTDADAVAAQVAATPFDRLIHLAGIAFAGSGAWQGFYAVNQIGSFALLDAVAASRPGARCILASTAQVYGPTASGLLTEAAPCAPGNHYAASKLAMETGTRLWGDRLDLTIVRPFNYTGVGQEARYLVPKIVEHFARRAPVIELGNTHVRRDFGDVRAVVQAYADLLTACAPIDIVNIASGRLWTIADIMDRLSALTGHRMEVKVNPAFVRAGEVTAMGGDITALQQQCPAWQPIALEATLAWMLDAARGGPGSPARMK